MSILDDLEFLGFVNRALEEAIEHEETVLDIGRRMFQNKQMESEVSKRLHTYQKWHDEISGYIQNKGILGDVSK